MCFTTQFMCGFLEKVFGPKVLNKQLSNHVFSWVDRLGDRNSIQNIIAGESD